MVGIALLGYGTVGQGVAEIIGKKGPEWQHTLGKELVIKQILVRNKEKERATPAPKALLTTDFTPILADPGISIVIEATGDVEAGYIYAKAALQAGKHLVTANKALVSKHMEELSALAAKEGLAFLYEASVGGGIPLIKPLREEVALSDIHHLEGILNGTSNYILTSMFEKGLDYAAALAKAQELGYAEADPSGDVEGYDSQRKLRILSTLALKTSIQEKDILVRGMAGINALDVEQVQKMQGVVKLVAKAQVRGDSFTAQVEPVIVPRHSYLAEVALAANCAAFTSDHMGELKFYGPGAGKLPTACAILRDVLDIVKESYAEPLAPGQRHLKNANDQIKGKYYLRISGLAPESLYNLLPIAAGTQISGPHFVIFTKEVPLKDLLDQLEQLSLLKEQYFLARLQ